MDRSSLQETDSFSPFMEHEGSLLNSDEHATGPCPEQDESTPYYIIFI